MHYTTIIPTWGGIAADFFLEPHGHSGLPKVRSCICNHRWSTPNSNLKPRKCGWLWQMIQ